MRATKWLSALAVAASTAWTAGCGVDTQITGTVTPDDFGPRNVSVLLARGQNSELTDVFAATAYAYITYSATDEINQQANGGSFSTYAVMDYHNRPSGSFGQATEAAWSGIYAAEQIAEADEDTGINPDTDPLIARMWLNAGLGERQLGEMHCEAVLNYGPDGGILLNNRGNYDPSNIVDADSVFRRVIVYAERALEVADAGVAAGEAEVDGWYLFDPEVIQASAHGLLAQIYLYLGQFELADDHAETLLSLRGAEHEEYTHMHPSTEYNDIFVEQFYDDEISVWGTPAHLNFDGDPRVPWAPCSHFAPGVVPGGPKSSSDFVDRELSDLAPCYNGYGVDGEYRTENNRYPRFVQLKYWDPDTQEGQSKDMEMVMGSEMLLIRAEAALERNDLGAFKQFIDQHRALWDLDEIDLPGSVGEFEYPNAEDDARSILDRERYLDLWLEGRRYMDLRRWEHPFWYEGHHLTPDHAALLPPGPRPFFCLPVPESECTTNRQLHGNPGCATLPPPGAGG